jgi:TolB-like protein/Flp pilus assembly protein TadD
MPDEEVADLRRRIAVLPLDDLTGNTDKHHVVEGLYEAIAFGLGSIRSLEVISTTSAETYRGTNKRAPVIGRELSVGSLLSGSVTAQDDSVRITLNLVDAQRDTREWTGRFEGDLSDLMRLEDDIARDVARQLRAHLTPREDSLLATSQQIDPRAGDLYLRARTAPSRAEAIPLLEEAIRIDPGFAAPYGELARRYGEEAFGGGTGSATSDDLYDRVVQLASRGLQIDSTLASALTALAEERFHRDWEYDAGLTLFLQALDINPSYSTAYMRIAGHQAAMGRADESIAAARTAQGVDPHALWPRLGLAENLYQLSRFEDALLESDVALRMAPGDRSVLVTRGLTLVRLGRHEEGLADLGQAADSAELAIGLALAGRTTEAVAIRDALADPARADRTPPYQLARVFATTGGTDRAISLLEQAAEERAGVLMWLNINPEFEDLRADSRVRALLERMNFPGSGR